MAIFYLDGLPLSKRSVETWREQIAWVPQKPYLLHDSVLNNIRLSRPQASLDQVIQAAVQAHAHEFIQAFPDGYETQIGEGGARLSGGQAQRIALARAFLRDTPVLVLDEPTAHLDLLTEQQVQESLQSLLAGRTALVIAHRMSTVRAADQILVIDQGRIVERGRHADLLAQGGLYTRLLQADRFVDAPDDPLWEANQPMQPAQPGTRNKLNSPPSLERQSSPRWSHVLQRLYSFLLPQAGLVGLSILAGFATIASSIGLMTASAYIISYAALGPSIAELQVAIVGVRFFGITRGLFRYLERYLSHQVTFRLLARLRVWFYQALEPLAPARLMTYRSSDLLARILGDIASLENFYVRVVAPPIVAILVALLAFIILARFDLRLGWVLAVFLFLAGAGLPLLTWFLGRKPGAEMIRQKAALSALILDGLQGMPDLAAYNQQVRHAASLARQNISLIQAQRRFLRVSAWQAALAGFLSNAGMLSVLVFAIPLVESGKMEGIYLAVAVLAALTSFEGMAPLPMATQTMGANLQAAQRLVEVIDAAPEVLDPDQQQLDSHPLPGVHPAALQVSSLRFTYPQLHQPELAAPGNRELSGGITMSSHFAAKEENQPLISLEPALDGISFDLPFGKRLAIVGPSGAGKSTLLNLLLRFWEFQEGQINLGGVDVRRMPAEGVRLQMAVVSQSTYLFSASLRDNLRIARVKASQNEIEQAVEQAGLADFVQQLPQGYDTWVGEHGLRLSGGERQRLAIARAFLKDAPVLILDEATANLDHVTEKEIMQTILGGAQQRSILMITHRLAFMQSMDEILVLDQGRISERGRHATLMTAGGLYQRMWELQHGWLADDAQERVF